MTLLRTLTIALAASAALGAASAKAAEATAAVAVDVVSLQQIQIEKTADLSFGQVVKPTAGTYTITLAPGGGRSASGGTGGQLAGGTVSTAKFDVSGEGGRTYSITIPSTVTLATAGGGANKEVTLTPDPQTSDTLGGSAGQSATKQLEVAGKLAVPATIQSGAYSGSFPVTVGYQ